MKEEDASACPFKSDPVIVEKYKKNLCRFCYAAYGDYCVLRITEEGLVVKDCPCASVTLNSIKARSKKVVEQFEKDELIEGIYDL